jgi:F0F1-type ATP synthase assembly protein I
MVGPSITDEEKERKRKRLMAGFVFLVGGSAGMIAVQGGADPVSVAAVTVGGLLLGVVLVYYLSSIASSGPSGPRRD